MKNFIRFLVLALIGFFQLAATCTPIPTTDPKVSAVQWIPNIATDYVQGYKVYVGIQTQVYPLVKDVGEVSSYSLTSLGLKTGVHYYLTVTAYNVAGESIKSAEVQFDY
jgi:hypothetical protein